MFSTSWRAIWLSKSKSDSSYEATKQNAIVTHVNVSLLVVLVVVVACHSKQGGFMHVLSKISSLHVWFPSYRTRGGVQDKRRRLQSDGEVFAIGQSVQGVLKGVLDTQEGLR